MMEPTRDFLLTAADAERVRVLVPASNIRKPAAEKRIALWLLTLAVLLIATLWLGISRAADNTQNWSGEAIVLYKNLDGTQSKVKIDVKWTVRSSSAIADLRFEAPWSCTLKAHRITSETVSKYELRDTAGGKCNQLLNEQITTAQADDGSLTLEFKRKEKIPDPVKLSVLK